MLADPTRLTGQSFEDACRASLERMGRDQIEIAQAHWSARNFQPWQEPALWDGLARCHEAGLARAVGTSNFGPKQLRRVHTYMRDRGVPLSVNQVQLSLLSTLPIESGLLETCAELGITPIGYSPLGLGVLSGKYDEERLPSGPRSLLFKSLLPSCRPLLGTLRQVNLLVLEAPPGGTVGQLRRAWRPLRGMAGGERAASQHGGRRHRVGHEQGLPRHRRNAIARAGDGQPPGPHLHAEPGRGDRARVGRARRQAGHAKHLPDRMSTSAQPNGERSGLRAAQCRCKCKQVRSAVAVSLLLSVTF